MLDDVISVLRCPVCKDSLMYSEGVCVCVAGHSFDVARQGYVNLLPGNARAGTADTSEMVAARARFFASGFYRPLVDAVAGIAAGIAEELAAAAPSSGHLPDSRVSSVPEAAMCGRQVIVDAGAGTGEYLAAVLDRVPSAAGLALDLSKHAMRRAARAHPRIGAAVCDTWCTLPVCDGAATVLLNVFSPRNAAEYARVIVPGGALIVVTPLPGHLAEIVSSLGMISVDERKEERLEMTLGSYFECERLQELVVPLLLTHESVRDLVLMGPSARHIDVARLPERIAGLPEPVAVTLAAAISVWRPACFWVASPY